tara:strand:+ start:60 stop:509 length:450 start_codon:yes stop_codon:yes gene_type:complete
MSFLEKAEKNMNNYLLINEISTVTTAGGFSGRSGQEIDTTYVGPFNPEYGDIGNLLNNQIIDRDNKVKRNNEVTPEIDPEMKYLDLDILGIEYDKNEMKADEKIFVNDTNDMKVVDLDIDYDKIKLNSKNKIFINDTNDWKYIYNNKRK